MRGVGPSDPFEQALQGILTQVQVRVTTTEDKLADIHMNVLIKGNLFTRANNLWLSLVNINHELGGFLR